ncbi:class I SAM-dependent methyltransferase [Sandarakinorhabdus rubra]|uniref:class I SAM-dependent methyltransferase n=1 Tax=Sandarakinorhabdus rubra TaxID=2672568 RepID=UPI0013DCAC97|nr:methyltransferase domain-containing protein [Sandarakinorhabdus rubra]
MDLKEEHLLGDQVATHWYYTAKRAALLAATRDVAAGHVLDVGAGSGYFSRALIRAGRSSQATCVDLGYPADSEETEAGRPIRFRTSIGLTDANLVLMMDVIEHVADDVGLVADYAGKVQPGTHFLITVPAFMWLWSGHDVFLEHYRRYTLAGIEAVLRAAGLSIVAGHYFYGGVLPMVAAVRGVRRLTRAGQAPASDMGRVPPLLNGLLSGLCAAEVPVMRLNRLGGTTAMVLARKA